MEVGIVGLHGVFFGATFQPVGKDDPASPQGCRPQTGRGWGIVFTWHRTPVVASMPMADRARSCAERQGTRIILGLPQRSGSKSRSSPVSAFFGHSAGGGASNAVLGRCWLRVSGPPPSQMAFKD